jgi:hypothetical protein
MITIDRFKPEDIEAIEKQDCQADVTQEQAFVLSGYESWTIRLDGAIVACGGVVPFWANRFLMWSQLSKSITPRGMVLLTRAVCRYLKILTGRVEALIVDGHANGHRWVKLLGFTLETPKAMKGVLPNGEDAYMYARVF